MHGFGVIPVPGVDVRVEAEAVMVVGGEVPVTSHDGEALLRWWSVGCHGVDEWRSGCFTSSRARREVDAPDIKVTPGARQTELGEVAWFEDMPFWRVFEVLEKTVVDQTQDPNTGVVFVRPECSGIVW